MLNVRQAPGWPAVYPLLWKAKRPLDARVVAELGAHTRAQGLTLMFSAAYQQKSVVNASAC